MLRDELTCLGVRIHSGVAVQISIPWAWQYATIGRLRACDSVPGLVQLRLHKLLHRANWQQPALTASRSTSKECDMYQFGTLQTVGPWSAPRMANQLEDPLRQSSNRVV